MSDYDRFLVLLPLEASILYDTLENQPQIDPRFDFLIPVRLKAR